LICGIYYCNKNLTTNPVFLAKQLLRMKTTFLFIISAFLFTNAFSQNNFTISGSVVNEATGFPMAAASVFAQNTTLGTVTDNEGNFKLILPNGGYDLIISFTGYKTENRRITSSEANEKIIFKLKEKEKELESVAVVSTNEVKDGFAKYGQFFTNEFIGKSANSKQCNIQNPDVLHFFFSKKKNRLKITATEPLIIKNNALGYNIKYELDSFTHEYKTEVSTYSGYPLFENIQSDSAQMQQWQTARRDAYKGSILHFMRSVYNKNMAEQEFEMQFIVKVYGKDEGIKVKDIYAAINYSKDDSTQTVEIIPNQNEVAILFLGAKPSLAFLAENPAESKDFKLSVLSFKPKESIIIEQNGYFYDQNDVTISGYWAWDKVAEMLPYDYETSIMSIKQN
jgi:CarboxypepD_reg-like domain